MVVQMHQEQVTSATITIDDGGGLLRGHDLVGAPMALGGVVFGGFSWADTNLGVATAYCTLMN